MALELGVGVEQPLRRRPGRDDDRLVARESTELQVAPARLALTEDLARTADLEVAFGELEAVRRLDHGRDPRRTVGRRRLGEQEASRSVRAAADATAELVQLEQPEAVGILDHHDRGVRDVDADLDHRGRDEDVELVVAECPHDRFLVGRSHLPVQQTDPQAGQLLGPEPLVLVGGGFRLELRRPLDERAHDVDLAPVRHFVADVRRTPRRVRADRFPPTSVTIGERPVGSSRSSDLSRSP